MNDLRVVDQLSRVTSGRIRPPTCTRHSIRKMKHSKQSIYRPVAEVFGRVFVLTAILIKRGY